MQRTKNQISYLKQGETLPGGNTVLYLSNTMIRFDDNSKLKSTEGFNIDGALVDLGLVKSRSAKAGKAVTLVFDQDKGFDPDLSLFILLKNNDRINGSGVSLHLKDRIDIKFSQKTFKQKLYDNPELQELFMTEVVDVLQTMLTNMLIDRDEQSAMTNNILGKLNSLIV